MRDTPLVTSAIVRRVPATYDRCIRTDRSAAIDVQLAAEQHGRYCEALRDAGIDVIEINANDRYPDCCFVEDPALVIGGRVVLLNTGEPSRRGEGEAIRSCLPGSVGEIKAPATLEGGDVLTVGNKIYVGLGPRSNRAGIEALRSFVDRATFDVIPVELQGTLHLKSVCTYLGDGCVVWCSGHFDNALFADYERVEVPADEAYAANCIALNGKVFVPAGFPATVALIQRAGFETAELPVSEFRKGDGGLSCLSIRF